MVYMYVVLLGWLHKISQDLENEQGQIIRAVINKNYFEI